MNIFKKYFQKKKEIEQPKPEIKDDFLSYLQKKSEEAQAKERDDLRASARKEACRAYDTITKGMMEAAAKGEFKYAYAIEDQCRNTLYLSALQSELKSWTTFKDIDVFCGRINGDRSSLFRNIGLTFYWDKKKIPDCSFPPSISSDSK